MAAVIGEAGECLLTGVGTVVDATEPERTAHPVSSMISTRNVR